MRKIANVDGHACPCTYQGRDKLLWCSSNDPQINKNAVMMIDVETGVMDELAEFDAAKIAFHITAPLNLPYCYVSTDCPDRTLLSQVFQVFYDKSPKRLIVADTGSLYTGYNSQVKAAVSSDGSKIVGCSNFGQTADPNYCDVWMWELAGISGNSGELPVIETDKAGEKWLNVGTLPFDEASDLVSFNSAAKSVTVYRRQ